MLGYFRSFIKSRFGALIALAFLALIALAFASADVTGSGFGGIAGGDRAASVGDSRIGTADLNKAVTNAFEAQRRENPTLTMQQFVASGAVNEVLDGMADRAAMWEWGKNHGMLVSDRLVDSEIVKIPAFQGPDGKFSQDSYRQLIASRGLTDQSVRDDIGKGLMARQVLVPGSFGARMPGEALRRYAALLTERREGTIAFIPSLAFAPKTPPSDADLAAFWKANAARYTRPERRTIRYAIVDEATLKSVPAPGEAEIAQRYKLNSAVYAPSETRSLTQVVVPTEAAAKALAAEIAGGKTIEAAASSKGLSAAKLGQQTAQGLSAQASKAVADAVFAAAQGTVAAPARSGIGWHVIRVDAITRNPGKTLEQARPEIVAALTQEKRRAALSDLSAKVEEQIKSGTGLADLAKSLGVELATSAPLQADGSVFGKPGERAPEVIAPLVANAFSMEREGEPQLAELQAGTRFAIYEVAGLTPAAPAPLAEIREIVVRDHAMEKGSAQARTVADKVLAAANKGTSLADAVKAAGTPLPAPQPIAIGRQQLTAMQQRVPPPLALMFSMAKGTNKRLEAPERAGWYVVSLKSIVPGQVAPNDPMLAQAGQELGIVSGREYAAQLRAAIRREVGVKRNDAAIKAVTSQLTGGQ